MLKVSPDDNWLLCGDYLSAITFYDINARSVHYSIQEEGTYPLDAAFFHHEPHLVVFLYPTGEDIRLFDVKAIEWHPFYAFKSLSKGRFRSVATHPKNPAFVATGRSCFGYYPFDDRRMKFATGNMAFMRKCFWSGEGEQLNIIRVSYDKDMVNEALPTGFRRVVFGRGI